MINIWTQLRNTINSKIEHANISFLFELLYIQKAINSQINIAKRFGILLKGSNLCRKLKATQFVSITYPHLCKYYPAACPHPLYNFCEQTPKKFVSLTKPVHFRRTLHQKTYRYINDVMFSTNASCWVSFLILRFILLTVVF